MKRFSLFLVLMVAMVANALAQYDPFHGRVLTFTNVQMNGDEYLLHIHDDVLCIGSMENVDVTDASAKFLCKKETSGGYSLYNEASGKYLIWRGDTDGHNNNTGVLDSYDAEWCDWKFADASVTKRGTIIFGAKRGDGNGLGTIVVLNGGAYDKYSFNVGYDSKYSNLYKITIDGVDMSKYTIDYELEDEAGNVFEGSYKGIPTLNNPSPAGAENYTLSDIQWSAEGVKAKIDFGFPVSKEGETPKATLISSFAGYSAKFFWFVNDAEEVKVKKNVLPTETTFPSYLWAMYPSLTEQGTFAFKIKNMQTDKFLYTNASYTNGSGSLDAGPAVLFLNETGSNFTANCKTGQFHYSSNLVLQYISFGSSSTNEGYLGIYAKNHKGTENAFETPFYTVTIGPAGAATLYTPMTVTIPEGVKVQYASNAADGKLDLVEVEDFIPEQSAVILTGNPATYRFDLSHEEVESLSDNMLFGFGRTRSITVTDKTDVGENGTIYGLGTFDGVTAFYHFVGDTYKGGKAYLEVPNAMGARFFGFMEDCETGIEDIQGAESAKDAVVYDLSGRRVQGAQKGIFIVNGKKVVR